MTIQPFLAAGPVIQLHVVAAVLAIMLGPIALARRSRDRWHRRAGNVVAHRVRMQAIYMLALMLTGAFTLFPGRLMSRILFPEAPVAGFVGVLALTGLGCAWRLNAVYRRARQTSSA